MAENIAISASILGLLSLISIVLGVCLFFVFWQYRSSEKKKTKWTNAPSEVRTGWLQSERKPLIPGQFSAKIVQPCLKSDNTEEDSPSPESTPIKKESIQPCGKIFFILRYLVEREELMVRLVQMEGFSDGEDIYNADSAYVDVSLKHIGTNSDTKLDNPPRLDIALQQVYYFIISQDQLFSYKLVFKVNTFDQSFRRTVSGEVEVNLFEELKKHIFTGSEVILSKEILPSAENLVNDEDVVNKDNPKSAKSSLEQSETYYPEKSTSPVPSHLSWDLECDLASSSSSGLIPYEDLSDGVQWHRLSGDSWAENLSFQWPHLSDSVVSVPSSFQFNPKTEIDRGAAGKNIEIPSVEENLGSPLVRRSISEKYINRYGRLSPPPKNFYHLAPIPVSARLHHLGTNSPGRRKHLFGNRTCPKTNEPFFTFDQKFNGNLCRKRSLSLPSLRNGTSQNDVASLQRT